MNPLFPALPEDVTQIGDEDLSALITEHETAVEQILSATLALKNAESTDEERETATEFFAGRSAGAIRDEMAAGVEAKLALVDEQTRRAEEAETFTNEIQELAAKALPEAEALAAEPAEGDETKDPETEPGALAETEAEVVAEAEAATADAAAEAPEATETVTETEPVAASASEDETERPRRVRLPAPPQPSRSRQPVFVSEPDHAVIVAAAGMGEDRIREGTVLDGETLAQAMIKRMRRLGAPNKRKDGPEERHLVGIVDFPIPEDRRLRAGDLEGNTEKIRSLGNPFMPGAEFEALVASGGLCAPLTPLYTLPSLASAERPVRNGLPSYQADRGGVTVPTPPTVGDFSGAITVIEESDDALGGTFATKNCLEATCPAFVDVAVGIVSHCRSDGNLNARAWPEYVANANEQTMAEHARVAEARLLDRIKALSINVTNGAETLGALIYLVDAIAKAKAGIRYRLRLPRDARFRALIPEWVPDMLVLDNVQTQFDRFRDQASIEAYLRSIGIEPVWYKDTPTTGTSQGFSAETAGAMDGFPDNVQWAIFPEGTFLHLDAGTLELGIVRDSSLNSTNDFQTFGEIFENVARIGPAQAALWVTSDLCASGQFPPAGTARTCD